MTTPNRQVNGYLIREALKRWERQRSIASQVFNDSLYKFSDDTKPSPTEVMQQFQQADANYAKLQDLQQEYNRNVTLTIGGESMRLSLAVKLIGGAGRTEKMWSSTLTGAKTDRYSYQQERIHERSKDVERAKPQLSQKQCLEYASTATQYTSNLRAAIALANTTQMAAANFSEQEFRTLFGDLPITTSSTSNTGGNPPQQTQGRTS